MARKTGKHDQTKPVADESAEQQQNADAQEAKPVPIELVVPEGFLGIVIPDSHAPPLIDRKTLRAVKRFARRNRPRIDLK